MKAEEKIKAVRNRNANYRGKFFVAVRTTKIVCTPDCLAKPLEKNIVFMIRLRRPYKPDTDRAKYV